MNPGGNGTRRRRRAVAVLLIGGAVTAGVAAPSALGRGDPDPRGIAGYGASAEAMGAQYAVGSPGLLPVGDPREGTIIEVDISYGRTKVFSGPVVNALAAPLYPGDTAAHLGTAVATFGGPELPNYAVQAEAQHPPSPAHGSAETFNGPLGDGEVVRAGGASSQANAGAGGGTAKSSAASIAVAPPATPLPLVLVAWADAGTEVAVEPDAVTARAWASATDVVIAGVIRIETVRATASTRSDGSSAVPEADLALTGVTVAGQLAVIDGDGVHLAGQAEGSGGAAVAESLLGLMAQEGIAVRLAGGALEHDAGWASASSGALVISAERTIPAISVPGLEALVIPGAAPVAVGSPDIPLRVEVRIGGAGTEVGAALRAVPSSPAPRSPARVIGARAGRRGADAEPGAPSPAEAEPVTQLSASEDEPAVVAAPATAVPAATLRLGSGVPGGLVVAGMLISFLAAGWLLALARWQLLEGRSP